MLTVVWVDELDETTTREVRELLLAARKVDGRPDISPGEPLPGEFASGPHLLARSDGVLAGYAHLDTSGDAFGRQVAELIVRPDHRRRGVGTEVLSALVDRAGGAQLRVWAHGDHPGAAALAERAGFSRARELLVMHTPVDPDWPEPRLPEGVSLRTFVPGQDEQAVIEVNARAFDWHPEQGRLTVDDLRAEEAADWFDADGFFLAEDSTGKLLGFHWTKVHPANPRRFGGRETGEVYVVGVDPGAQGGGLGKALTLAGLRYLRDRGLPQVILYVEGDNAPAIAVYSRLGFTRHEVDVQYER
ncbi:mycothiol synthase [Amycolatopsis methanolica]|uniref:Mycothiol acetyltransferase n=1 Tax=Amycolatopsis methanolica 239 TaxID=1068978 RepID=A0A076N2E5_AMYME|nr:mycothiol synthase [Amycolatopsis methanolica]AIJ27013.1 mycothiol biosynthesis acetyltransferase [Amycolatopsis methanolica 239]